MWLHAVRRCRDPSRRACVMFLFCTPDGVAENSRWLSDSATTGNWPHPKTHSNPQGCVWFPVAPRCFGTERTSCTRFQWRIPGFRLQVCPAATIGECFTPVWCVFLNHEYRGECLDRTARAVPLLWRVNVVCAEVHSGGWPVVFATKKRRGV